jgi:mannose-6-phosphate isomerase-like protein (cupin superfamily)
VGASLGLGAFQVYQVELPPGAETVLHNHSADQVEDVYAFLRGSGWVVVDGEPVAVESKEFVAVDMDSSRLVRAGKEGLTFIAICG